MYIGFDYGTANCSVASMQDENPVLIPLERDSLYIPSTLAAPTRDSVSEHLFRHRQISPADALGEQLLRRSVAANRDEDIDCNLMTWCLVRRRSISICRTRMRCITSNRRNRFWARWGCTIFN